ncbi:MAG TPA: CocE/NonD family hydrolase [Candidatus Sulfomarinibacteraceae bacterium]|nr:CocE/NonD family hydrolase [Candidatus Sulfomarinibacteraceae bacterium]
MPQHSLYEVDIRHNVRIPMSDDLELSANLFLPLPREPGETFPAILEMIPYRKDDWHYNSDVSRMSYLAQHGFAGCRLDVRGTGSSPGIAQDEYTPRETEDGYETVQWLAAQEWCNGNVGMWGISYGGFTSIQVAKMQPPALKAIAPMYATDDRYTDDVHYIGGCKTASELAQYAVGMVGMNALPPKREYAGEKWAEQWKERLEQTPPWLVNWLQQQTDGPYWRNGSLAPDYEKITCAVLHFTGWTDGYTDPALRMQEKCVNAPRKLLVGNWSHTFPDSGYPGPNLDWLHEMIRFFDYWLKGIDNGIMDEPSVTLFRRQYTEPEAFPDAFNGEWISADAFPLPGTEEQEWHLDAAGLQRQAPNDEGVDHYLHRPTLGSQAGLSWGAGAPPTGLARDLRRDEALSLTYTSESLQEALDVVGFPRAVLHLRCTAPVAHVVVRLTDVAPDGTSSLVSTGILNLTHREGHDDPQPLEPGQIYPISITLQGTGYRFLRGHRLRLSVASAYWPVIFPSPCRADNYLHRGGDAPSRLILPTVPLDAPLRQPPPFKTSPAGVREVGQGHEEPAQWLVTDDVINRCQRIKLSDAGTTTLPDGVSLFSSEMIELTAHRDDPAQARLYNEVVYRLEEHGYETEVLASGTIRATQTAFHIDVQLQVNLNGNPFWHNSWLESIPRHLL